MSWKSRAFSGVSVLAESWAFNAHNSTPINIRHVFMRMVQILRLVLSCCAIYCGSYSYTVQGFLIGFTLIVLNFILMVWSEVSS